MTLFSWIYMLTIWGLLLALNAYCFYAVFRKREQTPPPPAPPPEEPREHPRN